MYKCRQDEQDVAFLSTKRNFAIDSQFEAGIHTSGTKYQIKNEKPQIHYSRDLDKDYDNDYQLSEGRRKFGDGVLTVK